MKSSFIHNTTDMVDITAGKILIADPFLKDANFMRTVIVICEHQTKGSFGFVLNKQYDHHLNELISGVEEVDFPVYYGGPVQMDTIHFLHRRPDLITGGIEIIDGIFWGGDFNTVVGLVNEHRLCETDIRFFIGYSGWGKGQLDSEMKQKSWITSNATYSLIFRHDITETWKDALEQLGGEYKLMVNYPIDPQLN